MPSACPWDEEADQRLRAMAKDGVLLANMARLLGRSPRAVEQRLALLRRVARAEAGDAAWRACRADADA